MTKAKNKIKNLTRDEAYKLGYKKGFGRALGVCIGFIDSEEANIIDKETTTQMRTYALQKLYLIWKNKKGRNVF